MQDSNQQPAPEESQANHDADRQCESCGRFGTVAIGDRQLCVDCYGTCGSCCQGSSLED